MLQSSRNLTSEGETINESEKAQAIIRVVLVLGIGIYLVAMASMNLLPPGRETILLWMSFLYMPASLYFLWRVSVRPGNTLLRRLASMASDYTGTGLVVALGGEASLPVFAFMLWVTLGTGLRFGSKYLLAGTAISLFFIVTAVVANDYWQEHPFMVAMCLVTVTAVPMYVLSLLKRLESAYAAAREANLSKSRFLAQASHDLRQPIHAISLFTACLRDAGLQARELQMVDNIDRSLAGVSRLFKSLLDISTLDSGRVTPDPELVVVGDIIDDVVGQNEEAAQRCGTRLIAVQSTSVVEADRALLTTMVQNVVNNAIKYAAGKAILIGCRRHGSYLAIEVYDTGPGIAQEHQERVFEEFYQVRTRGDRDVDGVGLGLSIVRRLAELQRLSVRLQSSVGRGTRVIIEGLPLVSPAQEKRLRLRPMARPMPSEIEGLRVLLVEDDRAVLEATASLLRRWGCIVQTETTIPNAVEACDLLISDYDLGEGQTGTDCIKIVRHQLGRNVPAIMVTGHDAAKVREELKDAGVPVLAKPVQPVELRSVTLSKLADQTDVGPPKGLAAERTW